ncbi:diguanylate cyclase [Myxococcota bacterium]|nr:diguanylate cyclase [Myxococcota bacterium]MBU1432002.1 diguanylate cyclase [Myxococcota bacterium]MBU1896180.1 diguanylate cyclase [Myxococcota bacterium]
MSAHALEVPRSRVLIVDDVPINIKLLGHALRPHHNISVATGGHAALRLAAASPQPDLILLDISMPDLDGYEVCARLKADPLTADIPIIFITALDEEADEMKGLAMGAVDYITKPFSLPIVLARARTHLQLKHYRDQLRRMSDLDGLTGVPNRRRLDEAFEVSYRRVVEGGCPLAVIMIDIDHFKAFNDTYGHLAGDDCIRTVATALEALITPPGLLGRYGGEEFAAILPGVTLEEAMAQAARLGEAIRALKIPHARASVGGALTISLGVAGMAAGRSAPPQALWSIADACLYQAKAAGRDQAQGREI